MNILTPNMSSMGTPGVLTPLRVHWPARSWASRSSTPRASLRSSARGNRASDVSAGNEVVDGRFGGEVKAGKKGIRCRPPFKMRLTLRRGNSCPLWTPARGDGHGRLGSVKLTLLSGKERDLCSITLDRTLLRTRFSIDSSTCCG